jgi:low affinity Fe/Cu permease
MKAWWLANNKRALRLMDHGFMAVMFLFLGGILIYAGYSDEINVLIFIGVFCSILPMSILVDEIREFNRDEDLY